MNIKTASQSFGGKRFPFFYSIIVVVVVILIGKINIRAKAVVFSKTQAKLRIYYLHENL